MAEYILTCFWSHDPAIPLTPVLVGPVRATAATVWEGVKRRWISWCPASSAALALDLQAEGTPPDHQKNRSSYSLFFLSNVMFCT
jgi:hypothetical protein